MGIYDILFLIKKFKEQKDKKVSMDSNKKILEKLNEY
jgi:hypothetical protein